MNREELDALLSAQLDRALEPEEASQLARLLAQDASAQRRARELEQVDAALRRLAAAPIDAARLERARAEVRARLDVGAKRRSRGRLAFAAAALAAGIAALALWLPERNGAWGGDSEQSGTVRGETAVSHEIAPELDDVGDYEVIADLELLEYLADRESQARDVEPRG